MSGNKSKLSSRTRWRRASGSSTPRSSPRHWTKSPPATARNGGRPYCALSLSKFGSGVALATARPSVLVRWRRVSQPTQRLTSSVLPRSPVGPGCAGIQNHKGEHHEVLTSCDSGDGASDQHHPEHGEGAHPPNRQLQPSAHGQRGLRGGRIVQAS
jgi:hypothetical protein